MSGGPYGRGKAPERACLPVEVWPAEDRALWLAACTPGDLLDGDAGPFAGLRPHSRKALEKGYGRWLTFLKVEDHAALSLPPADRVTPERVRRFVAVLEALGNGSQTLLGRLQAVGQVAEAFAPDRDFRFIARLASRVRGRHKPVRDMNRVAMSEDLLGIGLSLLEAAGREDGIRAAVLHRDGLLIASTALLPLRRKNIASLELGRNLIRAGDGHSLVLDEAETKNGQPLELAWPEELSDALAGYLAVHRPLLAARRGRWSRSVGDALWVSGDGSPMTQQAIYDRIVKRTEEAGLRTSPHAFRHAAATTLAVGDPEHVRVAAPLLGHTTFTTTERHYRRAHKIEAHRRFIAAVFGEEQNG